MFEVGKDIFRRGFSGKVGDTLVNRRLRSVYKYVFVIAFIFFAARTIQLGFEGTNRSRLAGVNGAWTVQRADIVDRNGDILAKNVMSGHITLRPNKVEEPDKVALLIHQILPGEYSLNEALKLVNSSKKFIVLHKYATEKQREIVDKNKLEGLSVEPIQERKYPKRRLFSHVVGFVGNDGIGLEGAERIYEKYLIENKDPLQLSLDSRIQSVFYEQLSIAMEKYRAKAAMGMLMNSRTGEMIAMVSLPDFDPENKELDPTANRLFKPLRGVFEMGSIFKIFNTAMAMENGINKTYYVMEPFKIPNTHKKITDIRSFKPDHPYFTIEEIMLHSCNVGSAQIALDLPEGTQEKFFHRIHMDSKLDLEFGQTEKPLMPIKWGSAEKATVSFGHGIAVTPLHLLLGVNAMTNGGIYIYPTLRKRNVGAIKGERVLSDEISARLRGIMYRIVEETSAKKARVAGIKIGGKTGTAEKYVNGKADPNRNFTAFVGIFPLDAPQYIIFVALDEPNATKDSWGWKTAAWNSVPTAGKILTDILPLLFE